MECSTASCPNETSNPLALFAWPRFGATQRCVPVESLPWSPFIFDEFVFAQTPDQLKLKAAQLRTSCHDAQSRARCAHDWLALYPDVEFE